MKFPHPTSNLLILTCTSLYPLQAVSAHREKPNILFVISDDQSYPHTSAYGCPFVRTPGFDQVAQKGWLLNNAFVTSPGSSPSRASLLTGRYPWQIEEAGTHASSFPTRYICFPDLLEQAGYKIGYTGKGWGPGDWKISGRKRNPAGPVFNEKKTNPPYSGISRIAYADNFELFYSQKENHQPFYFWVGGNEPHRPYEKDSWQSADKTTTAVATPPFLPDKEPIRGDLLDYAVEIEWFDSQLVQILQFLKEKNELDNTLIIVMADNGMAFPAAKANCYEYGIHVPMAICWSAGIQRQGVSDELVSSIDLFSTIVHAAGIKKPKGIEGHNLLPYLNGKSPSTGRTFICAGRERHSSSRYQNVGYPMRCIRDKQYLYIRNFRPERWPAGYPYFINKQGEATPMYKAFFDIDGGPAWSFMICHKDEADLFPYFMKAIAKRPPEELYDIVTDPGCLHNLAGEGEYQETLSTLRKKMNAVLRKTKDSRYVGPDTNIWEQYPRLSGDIRKFPKPF